MSGQWAYVTAAYVVTGLGTLLVLGHSWLAMQRAEAKAAKLSPSDAP